ncbi:WhiB family transcriptional regulator [Streptomyces californicus]|uniref:WhiB family transcriptional regulator n=1 Tax=Streptomyces californicus TaxID=67351 RepID=UPI00296E4D57|nr:WhiB family transcriptional regulator [Streptomyces californicus]MDW4912644.1 WhiB family transcriptional regulator [Streptomyces californicus]
MSDTTACITHADLFQVLEDLSSAGISDQMLEGDQLTMFTDDEPDFRDSLTQVRELCAACPLLESCLFAAVTDHAVTGIVAGTTESDRKRIRKDLGVPLSFTEDNDIYLVGRRSHDPVDAEKVRAMTTAGQMTQVEMAKELNCSTRTVRRRQASSCNVRRRGRTNQLTPKKVLATAEQLLPWF